jgi:site-specific recombinase XerD
LRRDCQKLIQQAIAPSTKKTYKRQVKKFQSFCRQLGAKTPKCFSDGTIELWIAQLYKEGLAQNSIACHLAALRYHCLKKDIQHHVDAPRVRLMLRGVKMKGRGNKAKAVVTSSHIRRLKGAAKRILHGSEYIRFLAMISLAFYGFLRPSEFCISGANHHLRWKSIKLGKRERSLRLHLKSFKHSSRPGLVTVPATTGPCCPVRCFKDYIKTWKSSDKDPLFNLTIPEFQDVLEQVATAAQIKSRLTPHCFRHGGASWAAKAGWADARIKAHGRWKSGAYRRYVSAL